MSADRWNRRIGILLGALVAVVGFAVDAHASASDGMKYTVGSSVAGSASAACSAYHTSQGHPQPPFMIINPHVTDVTTTDFQCKADWQQAASGGGYEFWFESTLAAGSISACVAPGDMEPGGPCEPVPTQCDDDNPDVGTTFTAGNVPGPSNYCNPVTMCVMKVTARTGDTMTIEHSRDTCDSEDETARAEDPVEGVPETCEAVGDGEYCASASGDGQCGYMNDTFICLGKVKPNECKVLGDGGRVCGAQANSTPPVPDNGTPGEVAEPDGTISQERPKAGSPSNTYNYYNAGTVAGSARDPGTDGGAPDGGSPGGGGDGEGDGEGEVPPCEGATCGEGLPELEDIGTMTEAFTGFWSELQEVPLVEAAQDAAPAFPAGSCPVWSDDFSLYGESVEMDFSSSICATWADVSPVLSFVCLAFWGFLALRVLLSA